MAAAPAPSAAPPLPAPTDINAPPPRAAAAQEAAPGAGQSRAQPQPQPQPHPYPQCAPCDSTLTWPLHFCVAAHIFSSSRFVLVIGHASSRTSSFRSMTAVAEPSPHAIIVGASTCYEHARGMQPKNAHAANLGSAALAMYQFTVQVRLPSVDAQRLPAATRSALEVSDSTLGPLVSEAAGAELSPDLRYGGVNVLVSDRHHPAARAEQLAADIEAVLRRELPAAALQNAFRTGVCDR